VLACVRACKRARACVRARTVRLLLRRVCHGGVVSVAVAVGRRDVPVITATASRCIALYPCVCACARACECVRVYVRASACACVRACA
jgi:hypothetical protein